MSDNTDRERPERELADVLARETRYRTELAARSARSSRLRVFASSLQELLRDRPPQRRRLTQTLLQVARISSQALEVPRASIWLLDDERSCLKCLVQLNDGVESPPTGMTLICADHEAYIEAVSEQRAVAVGDALNDARTRELGDYLRVNQIGALLDIPIVIPGELLGVVCHEHVGKSRVWHDEEIDFATNVGSLVALALETERRLMAEYAARGTEAKYRYLVESLPVAVYSFEVPSGKLDYVSPRVEELSGLRAEELLGTSAEKWVERIHPEDRGPVLTRFELGAGPGFPTEISYRIIKRDGSLCWLRDTCRVVRDPLGRAVGLQGVLADVSDRVSAEHSRDEFERRYRALLESAELLAVVLDERGRVSFVNDCFSRVTGFFPELLRGKDWFDTVIPADERERERTRFSEGLESGSAQARHEGTICTEAGEVRRILWTTTVLRRSDGSVEGTSSLGFDLTDRARLESQLVEQTKLESLGRLAAGVAHDFNNLLLVMDLERSALREAPSGPRAKLAHENLTAAINQASDLTRSLLVYGRSQPLQREPVALDALIEETLPLAAAIAGQGVEVTISLHAPGTTVLCDRAQVRQLILNLVGNAADALSGHGKFIRISSHIEYVDDATARRNGAQQGGDFAVLAVTDEGKGMDSKTLSRAFDPFFTTKQTGQRTGLGLATCQAIMSRAHGFITVESELGNGATFRLYFPCNQPKTIEPAPASMPSGTFGVQSGRRRVLLVEDLPQLQRTIGQRLRSRGYQVMAVGAVLAATRVLATEPVDLLLTDASLPDGSGPVLARSARAAYPGLRVILMSGSVESEWEDEFDAVLVKPFGEQELVQSIERVLGDPSEAHHDDAPDGDFKSRA